MIYECANAYYFAYLNKIGGIESHLRYLGKKYKYDIVVFYEKADDEQLREMEKYVSCIKLEFNDFVKCKNLFCCFNRAILDRCEAEKKYLVLHGDYKAMLEQKQLSEKNLPVDKRIDEYLGVSQLVCDSWEELTGIKARNMYNPVVIEKTKPLMFVSATRLTAEKGWERMRKLAEVLDENEVNYLWFVYTNSPKKPLKNMVFVEPRLDITSKIGGYDAFIQLSDNEGYCLSVVEALLQGVPVIVTDLPVLKEIGVNSSNSVILDFGMENIPIDEIKAIDKKKFVYKQPEDKWDEVLDHSQAEEVKVKALKGFEHIFDSQLGRYPAEGEELTLTKSRYWQIKKFEENNGLKLIERI